jgi:hypothetical protein
MKEHRMTQRTRKMAVQKPLFETSVVENVMAVEGMDGFGLLNRFDADRTEAKACQFSPVIN